MVGVAGVARRNPHRPARAVGAGAADLRRRLRPAVRPVRRLHLAHGDAHRIAWPRRPRAGHRADGTDLVAAATRRRPARRRAADGRARLHRVGVRRGRHLEGGAQPRRIRAAAGGGGAARRVRHPSSHGAATAHRTRRPGGSGARRATGVVPRRHGARRDRRRDPGPRATDADGLADGGRVRPAALSRRRAHRGVPRRVPAATRGAGPRRRSRSHHGRGRDPRDEYVGARRARRRRHLDARARRRGPRHRPRHRARQRRGARRLARRRARRDVGTRRRRPHDGHGRRPRAADGDRPAPVQRRDAEGRSYERADRA